MALVPSNTIDDLKKILDFSILSTRGEVKLASTDQPWDKCRLVRLQDGTLSGVKDHAKIGVRALIVNPWFAIFDEMGLMKCAQVIIAAQILYMLGVINRVIVVTPNTVRDVWYDKDLGELSLHLFDQILPNRVSEFHAKVRQWDWGNWEGSKDQLRWIITNYEFIARSKMRLKQLKAYCGPRTLLVLDESSAVANKGSLQSKACLELRRACGRIVLLNGTPIVDSPMSLMNQANILHPSILECPYVTIFRERYCVMNPKVDYPQILRWKNLDDIQRRLAPYVLRRLSENCLDLPPRLPAVTRSIALTPNTWKTYYKPMKQDMVSWVSSNQASIAGLAITKAMRLAQITSGFIGGVEEVFEETQDEMPAFMQEEDWFLAESTTQNTQVKLEKVSFKEVKEIGREKLDDALDFYAHHLSLEPNFKLVVWCRFKPELHRFVEEFQRRFPHVRVAVLEGGQKKTDRILALRLLHPRTAIMEEPAMLAGTYGTGSMGHNFTAAHVDLDMSYDYSLFKYTQKGKRIHRPGQTKPVSSYVMVATGPGGQKTIDHSIVKARTNKADVADWTAKAWLDVLSEE